MLSNLWNAYLSINGDVGSTELKRWGEENEKKRGENINRSIDVNRCGPVIQTIAFRNILFLCNLLKDNLLFKIKNIFFLLATLQLPGSSFDQELHLGHSSESTES